MKIIENNFTKNIKTLNVKCSNCESMLEIKENDAHVGWLGYKFITCPCCGRESIVYELDGITLNKDNIIFPTHFSRSNKNLPDVTSIPDEEINKDICKGIDYLRKNKNECFYFATYGDLFLILMKEPESKEYYIVVTKDFYETYIPFEEEDY